MAQNLFQNDDNDYGHEKLKKKKKKKLPGNNKKQLINKDKEDLGESNPFNLDDDIFNYENVEQPSIAALKQNENGGKKKFNNRRKK